MPTITKINKTPKQDVVPFTVEKYVGEGLSDISLFDRVFVEPQREVSEAIKRSVKEYQLKYPDAEILNIRHAINDISYGHYLKTIYFSFDMFITRLETDKEYAARLKGENKKADKKKQKMLDEYTRLKEQVERLAVQLDIDSVAGYIENA